MTGTSPPEVAFRNLMQRQAFSAVRISGAEVSLWNGQWVEMTGGPAGVANWDGSIGYDKQVLDRLRHMMAHYGRHHDPQTLAGYREAIRVVLHENSHLLSHAGEKWSESSAYYWQPSVAALEEGVTEAWAQANTDAYIRDLGLEQAAPGISGVPRTDAYPQYTPAVRALCQGLGRNMGVPEGEVLRRLNVVSARGKWPAVAEMVMQSSGLSQQIKDPLARTMARDRIQAAMQNEFSNLAKLYDPSKPIDAQAFKQMQLASYAAGQAAIGQAQQQVDALRLQHATPPAPTHQVYVGRARVSLDPNLHPPPQTTLAATAPGAVVEAQRALALTQAGVAPIAGGRPIDPGQPADGAKPETVRTAERTGGREPGD
jgi:hypothetical protein